MAGWSLGMGIGFAVWYDLRSQSGLINTDGIFELDFRAGDFLGAILLGTIVTIGQGIFVLSKRRPIFSLKWLIGTVAGTLLGFVLTRFLGVYVIQFASCSVFCWFAFDLPPKWFPSAWGIMNFSLGGPISGGILGGMIGLGQALLLEQGISAKVIWIALSAIGLAIAFVIGTLIWGGNEILAVGAFVGLIYGIITALPLDRLIRPERDAPFSVEPHQ